MKTIFSKSGNRKEVSGKMDRGSASMPNVTHSAPTQPNPMSQNASAGRVNSFIPTASSYHHGQNVGSNKQGLHAQQQSFYSNIPGNQTLHYGNYQQQQSMQHQQQHQQVQNHQRILSKSYSASHQNQNANQQPQPAVYGNTTGYNHNHVNHSHVPFYGNTGNLPNGSVMVNGHGHHQGQEKTIIMNGHHHPSMMNHSVNIQNQNIYNHEHSQQVQKVHVQPQRAAPPNNGQSFQQYNQIRNANVNGPTEGLPPALVESMRTLFDILDDAKQGKIRLSDIETRWESDSNNGSNGKGTGAEPLIKMGVLEYLRKVTPADGMLTFDRFCSGLRLALITNNGNDGSLSCGPQDNFGKPQQLEKLQQRIPTNPQQYVQEQQGNQRPMVNHQVAHILPSQALVNSSGKVTTNSQNQAIGPSGQSNTIQRFSRIPNISSSSRLPMPNSSNPPPSSGIPISPSNKANTIPLMSNANKSHLPNHNHHNGTLISGTKRYPSNNSEQGTLGQTVALVHPQPPPNPKPGHGNYSQQNSYGTLGFNKTISNKQIPLHGGGGFSNRYSSKNNSLDDLQVTQGDSSTQGKRPPSAPILDDDNPPKANETKVIRERAKSQERDRAINSGGHGSRAEEKSNFAKARQRTLSMPQLQLNKMKTNNNKATVNFEDSAITPEKVDSSPVENYPKPSTLKNHTLSKLLAGGHQYSGSAIPTMSPAKQGTTNTGKGEDNDTKELPPPPPKPPRNGFNGPVLISTTLITGLTNDPPLSGSSFGSGATMSPTTSSGSGGGTLPAPGNNKPSEIKSVLNTWQKNFTEKKASLKSTVSASSIGTTVSSSTATTTTGSLMRTEATNGPTGPGDLAGGNANATNNPNGNSDEVKLRTNKSNLKRNEKNRRHTVQSGIDFTTLKRLKQLEQERDVLQQGQKYLEKANEWYLKQLDTANDKISLLSKGAPTSDYWSESHEERLNLLGCRITEVNSLLTALMDGAELLHMNLQIPSHLSLRTITRLKDQNRQLTQEVSNLHLLISSHENEKHRITQLEKEKSMLLRQLFHQKNSSNSEIETVYM